jgi:hypothetical protein
MTDHQVVSREEWQAAGRDEGDGFQTWIRRRDEYA